MNLRRIVITGPTGAIGVALIQLCIREKIEVYALVRSGSKRIGNIPQNKFVHIVECDLEQLSELSNENIPCCDVFFHLGWASTIGAGRNDMSLQLKNIQYTLDAVALADRLHCECFVGTGSQAEYGRHEGVLNENVPTHPENGYGVAKLCAGQMSRLECSKYNIRHIWTRILSVYGPYDTDKTMITSTIKSLLNGEKPLLTAGGQQWDYLYSEDAARALLLLAEKGQDGKVYCLGSGSTKPLREYVQILKNTIDPSLELGLGEIPYGEKQVMYLCADTSELVRLGFKPQTNFDEGIKNTIEWMKMRM